ncbi:MAG: hypothetical protein ACRDH7_16305 [Actinomycetota bacterium]
MAQFRERKWFRRVSAVSLLFGIMAVASVAYAAWTASGSGQGYAKAGTAQALTTVDVSASTTASLYPSGTGNVLLRINNSNPYPVQVTTVSGSGAVTSDKGAACDASTGVTFTNQTGLTLSVPASSAATFTLTGAAAMSNASDNSCQGAVFTIPVSLSGASN